MSTRLYMYKKDREEIIDYLESLRGRFIYDEDLMEIKRRCFGFMGIESEEFAKRYSLKIFNGFMDDYFGEGTRNYYTARFALRDDRREYLPDGSRNPHFGKHYWRIVG